MLGPSHRFFSIKAPLKERIQILSIPNKMSKKNPPVGGFFL